MNELTWFGSKCVHCKVRGKYAFDRCDTCAAAGHNHALDMCMACHPEEAEWLGVLGIMPAPAECMPMYGKTA